MSTRSHQQINAARLSASVDVKRGSRERELNLAEHLASEMDSKVAAARAVRVMENKVLRDILPRKMHSLLMLKEDNR